MPTYNVHDAKTNLSKLLERADAGAAVSIARRDTPAVKLVPVEPKAGKRQFGAYKGKMKITDAFFEPLPEEELAAWEGDGTDAEGRSRNARKS